MMTKRATAMLLALAGSASVAFGDVTFVSQERSIYAELFTGPSEFIGAPDFGVFNESVYLIESTEEYVTEDIAHQNSTLAPDRIFFDGSTYAAGGYAASSFHVVFDTDTPVEYTLDYRVDAWSEFGNATAELFFDDLVIGGFIAQDPFGFYEQGVATGTLKPGQHSLTINLDTLGTHSAGARVDLRLNPVPAPGALAALGIAGLAASRRRR